MDFYLHGIFLVIDGYFFLSLIPFPFYPFSFVVQLEIYPLLFLWKGGDAFFFFLSFMKDYPCLSPIQPRIDLSLFVERKIHNH